MTTVLSLFLLPLGRPPRFLGSARSVGYFEDFLRVFLPIFLEVLDGTYPLRGSSVKLDPIRAIGLDGSI
ncbi:hypothetical protein QUB49_36690, partial [Microcoleus sp. AT9_B4]